jgi:hypothetical protein
MALEQNKKTKTKGVRGCSVEQIEYSLVQKSNV